MITEMKQQFYQLIKDLGYTVTDNGNYEEVFPYLMIRTGDHKRMDAFNVRMDSINFILDIFSTYNGEKEILEIVENIADNLYKIRDNNEEVKQIAQSSLTIIGDNTTGPVNKHGVVTYIIQTSFPLVSQEGEDNGES